MRRFAIALLVALLSNALAWPQQPAIPAQPSEMPLPPGNFKIGGVIVQRGSGRPIRRARVTIIMNEHAERKASLFTAEDGRFTFTDVPAGKYTLQAEVRGQFEIYQQDDDQFSTGIVTGRGFDSEHLLFEFPPTTTLNVDVIDEENEPVRSTTVMLIRRHVTAGWPQIRQDQQTATDFEGTAHFSHLKAGTYYIAVTGRPWYAQNAMAAQPGTRPEDTAALNVAYPITYYAGTQDPNAATPLTIAEGDKAHVQVALHAVPAAKIVLDGVPGSPDPARGGQIVTMLQAVGPGGVRINAASQSYEANGEREISGFAPGNYLLSNSTFGPQDGMQRSFSSAHVNVGSETRLNVSEMAHTNVSGQVTVEGGGNAVGSFVIFLVDVRSGLGMGCPVRQKNEFQCHDQTSGPPNPGWYEVRLPGRSNRYVKSVAAVGARYQSGLLEIREDASVNLSITIGQGATQLDGTVIQNDRPLSGAMVLLVPQDFDMNKGIPRDQSDSDGTFTLPNVQPGRYFVVAIDHGHDLEYHNRQVLAPYLEHAQTVEIPLPHGVDSVRVNAQKR